MLKYLIYLELMMVVVYSSVAFLRGLAGVVDEIHKADAGKPSIWLWWNVLSAFFAAASAVSFFAFRNLALSMTF